MEHGPLKQLIYLLARLFSIASCQFTRGYNQSCWRYHGDIIGIQYDIPSGQLSHNYGQSPLFMGKTTTNHHFQQFFVCLPEGSINKGGIMRLYGESASSGVAGKSPYRVPSGNDQRCLHSPMARWPIQLHCVLSMSQTVTHYQRVYQSNGSLARVNQTCYENTMGIQWQYCIHNGLFSQQSASWTCLEIGYSYRHGHQMYRK